MTNRRQEIIPTEPTRRALSRPARWSRLLPWLITAACFTYLLLRLDGAAAREGKSVTAYLAGVFAGVPWDRWLALMVPYSFFFFLIDSLVVWRVINWFNARVRFVDILPIRGSTYILSILNEQVGKGAMALYLYRREGVPGWQLGSSMLFIMFCEFLYLSSWATIGVALRWERFATIAPVFHWVPWITLSTALIFALLLLYFRGTILPNDRHRDRPILHAFRSANLSNYLVILLLRSPALLTAVVVYTLCLRLFGVPAEFGDMLAYLPVVFFGAATPGPMRSVAILLWVLLFPDYEGQMTAFGFVQHNFFIFFNAAIGLVFVRRANRELFGAKPA
jgi:hypothetical protein